MVNAQNVGAMETIVINHLTVPQLIAASTIIAITTARHQELLAKTLQHAHQDAATKIYSIPCHIVCLQMVTLAMMA